MIHRLDSTSDYRNAIRAGDRRAVARAITRLESTRPDHIAEGQAILAALLPYAGNSLANKGWRIDHILATPPLAGRCKRVEVDVEPRRRREPSDHTVLWAESDI